MNQPKRPTRPAHGHGVAFGARLGRCELHRAALGARSLASCRCSLRHRAQHSSYSGDVARGHGELEVLIDAPESSVDGLADAADCLAPAEVFLDALSDRLAGDVARVAR